jgi:hypothetical protein
LAAATVGPIAEQIEDATQPDNWEAIKALFDAALELDSSTRSAFLRNNCSDAEVRTKVERLLNEHDQAEAFLSTPVLGHSPLEAEAPTPTQRLSVGQVLAGRFRIVRFIAVSAHPICHNLVMCRHF